MGLLDGWSPGVAADQDPSAGPKKWTYLRWPVLTLSLLVRSSLWSPATIYMTLHIDKALASGDSSDGLS